MFERTEIQSVVVKLLGKANNGIYQGNGAQRKRYAGNKIMNTRVRNN